MPTPRMNCPRCGGDYARQSGFRRCVKCGHVAWSQDVRSYQGDTYQSVPTTSPTDDWEVETHVGDKPGKQNTPLKFKER